MKEKIKKWIFLAIIAYFLPLIIYSITFFKGYFPHDKVSWQDFASIINGISTPMLAVINIIVLIKLTIEVAEFNKQNEFIQFKQLFYNNISKILYSIDDIIQKSMDIGDLNVNQQINSFLLEKNLTLIRFNSLYNTQNFFYDSKVLDKHATTLIETINLLINYDNLKKINDSVYLDQNDLSDLVKDYELFVSARREFLIKIQLLIKGK